MRRGLWFFILFSAVQTSCTFPFLLEASLWHAKAPAHSNAVAETLQVKLGEPDAIHLNTKHTDNVYFLCFSLSSQINISVADFQCSSEEKPKRVSLSLSITSMNCSQTKSRGGRRGGRGTLGSYKQRKRLVPLLKVFLKTGIYFKTVFDTSRVLALLLHFTHCEIPKGLELSLLVLFIFFSMRTLPLGKAIY